MADRGFPGPSSSLTRVLCFLRTGSWVVLGLVRTPIRDFTPVPLNHLARTGGFWSSLGDDPHFDLRPKGHHLTGPGRLTIELIHEGDDPRCKLYPDSGSGFSEETAVLVPSAGPGVRQVDLHLPAGLRSLRLDPLDRPGRFRLGRVRFTAANPVRYAVHRLWGEFRAEPRRFLSLLRTVVRHATSGRAQERLLELAVRHEVAASAGAGCSYFMVPDLREPYAAWLAVNRPTSARRAAIDRALAGIATKPRFSVLMPVWNTPEALLREAVASVTAQTWDGWELVLVDDASTAPGFASLLADAAAGDQRIRCHRRDENGNISRATNTAAELARHEWLVFLDHDDLLEPDALALLALHIAGHPADEIIYSDDDKIDEAGRRYAPQFKPDWSPELLLSFCYTSHIKCVTADLWRRVGGFRTGFEGSQDYDFLLRATEVARSVGHLPQVLYHWRAVAGSTAVSGDAKPAAIEAGRRAVEEAFARRGVPCRVEQRAWAVGAGCGAFAPVFPDQGPRVAILIPTKNQWQVLKRCLDSLAQTGYRDYRVIVIDNESDEPASLDYLAGQRIAEVWRIANPAGRFNYAHINNEAARRADDAELLLFLNNDTEVRDPRWLSQLVGWSRLPGVGAVGARLLYPDGRIQHGGITHGLYHGLVGPSFKLAPGWDLGYLSLAGATRNCLAVTAACMLTPRRTFLDLGGFDAERFAVAYNDVDYGYRLAKAGLRSVYCAEAELLHHEGLSRGFRDDPREVAAFRRATRGLVDPFYNPHLGLDHERFPIVPRVLPPTPERWPVRTVLLTHNLNWEGAPMCLLEVAAGLKARGAMDPVLWSPVDGPLRQAWEEAGIPVTIVVPPNCGGTRAQYLESLDRLGRGLREAGAEVAYGNTMQSFWLVDAARRVRLPAVWNVHESEPWASYFDFLPGPIAARALAAMAYPYRVVFVAETTRQAWSALDTSRNFTAIRNGLDRERHQRKLVRNRAEARARLGLAEGEVALLLLGTVCARKGQQDLVDALAILPDDVAARVRCLVVGDRPGPYSRQLHARLAALPEDRRSRMSVVAETGETGDYWAAADVFVCTSRVECYPRVVLEAMNQGLPVITTPCFGTTEQIRAEVNGRFYPMGDLQALATAIAEVVRDDALRAEWSANSPHVLAGLTDFDEMLAGYAEVVRDAAISHPPDEAKPDA